MSESPSLVIIDGFCRGNNIIPSLSRVLSEVIKNETARDVEVFRFFPTPHLPKDVGELALKYSDTEDLFKNTPPPLTPKELIGKLITVIHKNKDRKIRIPVILTGDLWTAKETLSILIKSGLRPHLKLLLYFRGERLPIPSKYSHLFRFVDEIIAESKLAAQAVKHCCNKASPRVETELTIIQPLISSNHENTGKTDGDSDTFRIISAATFRPVATAIQSMIVFRLFLRGDFSICTVCDRLTPFSLDIHRLHWNPVELCRYCKTESLRKMDSYSSARLHIFVEPRLPTPVIAAISRIIAIERKNLGLDEYVTLSSEENNDNRESIVECLSNADVCLCCDEGTAFPPLLFPALLNKIPVVAADFGSNQELKKEYAEQKRLLKLVPTGYPYFTSEGNLQALIDPSEAAFNLAELYHLKNTKENPNFKNIVSCEKGSYKDWMHVLEKSDNQDIAVKRVAFKWLSIAGIRDQNTRDQNRRNND